MNHQREHIQKQKNVLIKRSHILKAIREFFWQEQFHEVETPYILRLPGQEPYLSPVTLTIHDDRKKEHAAFLHTSPEYTMKKMLAAGFDDIFFLGKTFRDYESFGGTHNPEFTMLEWYRVGASMFDLMEDVESLFNVLQEKMKNVEFVFQRKSMKEVWMDTINVNLDEHLTQPTMLTLCKERGYKPQHDESYEDLFYRIFLNEIEPTF